MGGREPGFLTQPVAWAAGCGGSIGGSGAELKGSKKIHMRRHPAVRGKDGWGCRALLRKEKETGLIGDEQQGKGKWKTEAVGAGDDKFGERDEGGSRGKR